MFKIVKEVIQVSVISRPGASPGVGDGQSGTCLSKLPQQVSQVWMKSP